MAGVTSGQGVTPEGFHDSCTRIMFQGEVSHQTKEKKQDQNRAGSKHMEKRYTQKVSN